MVKVKSISPENLKTMMDENHPLQIVDCRNSTKWLKGHIPNAVHLHEDVINKEAEKLLPQKDIYTIVYCERGPQSIRSCFILKELGYTSLAILEKGIAGWIALEYEVIIPKK